MPLRSLFVFGFTPLRVRKGWYLSRFAEVIICLACERYHVSRVNLRERYDTFRVNLRGTYHTSRVKFCARGIMTPAYAKDLNFWNVRVLNLSHCEQHDHSRTTRTLCQLLFSNIIYVENVKMVPFDAEGSIYISNPWGHIFYHEPPQTPPNPV